MKASSAIKKINHRKGNSSSPMSISDFAPCGHSNCDSDRCRVRYIGPTTPVSHHHIMHAAKGVTHIWTAVIVAGLAMVITGATAYSVAQAKSNEAQSEALDNSTLQIIKRLDAMESRINSMERDWSGIMRAQNGGNAVITTPDQVFPKPANN